jgi:hypothetical protein
MWLLYSRMAASKLCVWISYVESRTLNEIVYEAMEGGLADKQAIRAIVKTYRKAGWPSAEWDAKFRVSNMRRGKQKWRKTIKVIHL